MTFNTNILYAFATFCGGGALVAVSFSMILWPFMDYLHMRSVVFDSTLAYIALRIVNVIDNHGAILGTPLLAASAFFLARYTTQTTIRWRRMAAISGATITGCYVAFATVGILLSIWP